MQISLYFLLLLFADIIPRPTTSVLLGAKSTAKNVIDVFAKGRALTGKTALVTGGNSGIGLETCKALASAGCRVILCSRTVSAGKEAIDREISCAGLDGTYQVADSAKLLTVKQLDLEDLDSVRRLATDVIATEAHIDFLVLNAGIMSLPTLERTKNGWEKQMAVNHFGHAFLVNQLLPFLAAHKERPTRIVLLASTAHRFATAHPLSDPTYKTRRYTPWVAYGDSKLANLVYAKALATHLWDSGSQHITSLSVHPGVIKTPLWNKSVLNRIFGLFVGDRGIPEGAASTLWACLSPRGQDQSLRGAYIADCAPAQPLESARSDDMREEVWRVTQEELLRVGAV